MFQSVSLLCFMLFGIGKTAEIIPIPDEIFDFARQTKQKCVAETGVVSDVFENILSWSIKDEDVEATKRFIHCFFTKGGFVTDDGNLKIDEITSFVGSHRLKDDFKQGLEICNSINSEDKIDKMYKEAECFIKKSPIMFPLNVL